MLVADFSCLVFQPYLFSSAASEQEFQINMGIVVLTF